MLFLKPDAKSCTTRLRCAVRCASFSGGPAVGGEGRQCGPSSIRRATSRCSCSRSACERARFMRAHLLSATSAPRKTPRASPAASPSLTSSRAHFHFRASSSFRVPAFATILSMLFHVERCEGGSILLSRGCELHRNSKHKH